MNLECERQRQSSSGYESSFIDGEYDEADNDEHVKDLDVVMNTGLDETSREQGGNKDNGVLDKGNSRGTSDEGNSAGHVGISFPINRHQGIDDGMESRDGNKEGGGGEPEEPGDDGGPEHVMESEPVESQRKAINNTKFFSQTKVKRSFMLCKNTGFGPS